MFGIHDYGAFCAAVLIFLAIPGPGNLALVIATTQGGVRAGMSAALGLLLGDQVLLWLAVAGVASLMAAHPGWFSAVQWLGAIYLAWLGLRLVWPRPGQKAALTLTPGRYVRQGLFITVLNPKAIVFYMAFFPLFIHPATHQGLPTFAAMALTIAVLSLAYCFTACSLAHYIKEKVSSHQRIGRWVERVAGVSLIGFGIKLGVS